MRFFLSLVIFGCVVLAGKANEFDVNTVIHPVVAELPSPKMIEGFDEGKMAITTNSEEAARHFSQGLTLMNTAWEFEAYRHFCEAVKLDPKCLMAYWGISFSLSGGNHEFFAQRKAAIERMLDLLEAEKEDGKDRWNALETGFVQGAGYLMTDGPGVAGKTFSALAEKFPANTQARILAHFLERDGFDRFGKARFGQRKAEEGLEELLKAHPENLSVMAVWVNTLMETPGQIPMLKEKALPVARKLVELHPDYAPFFLILTHVEARCGNVAEAVAAALRARKLYNDYLGEGKVTIYDCDGLVRAELYLATLYRKQGKMTEALEVAKKLAEFKVEEERIYSRGAIMLMWEGRTLAARMMAGGKTKEDFLKGQAIMNSLKDEKEWFKEKSFALFYRDSLAFYLGSRAAIAEGKMEEAKGLYDQLALRAQGMGQTRAVVARTAFYANWIRAIRTLEMLLPELRGLLAEEAEGASRGAAVTWYLAARDRQERPANLLPPSIGYPMQLRLGNHHLELKKYEEAVEWYQKGNDLRPSHPELLEGLQAALTGLGKKEDAAAVKKQLEALRK